MYTSWIMIYIFLQLKNLNFYLYYSGTFKYYKINYTKLFAYAVILKLKQNTWCHILTFHKDLAI